MKVRSAPESKGHWIDQKVYYVQSSMLQKNHIDFSYDTVPCQGSIGKVIMCFIQNKHTIVTRYKSPAFQFTAPCRSLPHHTGKAKLCVTQTVKARHKMSLTETVWKETSQDWLEELTEKWRYKHVCTTIHKSLKRSKSSLNMGKGKQSKFLSMPGYRRRCNEGTKPPLLPQSFCSKYTDGHLNNESATWGKNSQQLMWIVRPRLQNLSQECTELRVGGDRECHSPADPPKQQRQLCTMINCPQTINKLML